MRGARDEEHSVWRAARPISVEMRSGTRPSVRARINATRSCRSCSPYRAAEATPYDERSCSHTMRARCGEFTCATSSSPPRRPRALKARAPKAPSPEGPAHGTGPAACEVQLRAKTSAVGVGEECAKRERASSRLRLRVRTAAL